MSDSDADGMTPSSAACRPDNIADMPSHETHLDCEGNECHGLLSATQDETILQGQDAESECVKWLCDRTPTVKWSPEEWVQACEFVPGQRWQSLGMTPSSSGNREGSNYSADSQLSSSAVLADDKLAEADCSTLEKENEEGCVFFNPGECSNAVGVTSEPSAGEICELCGSVLLTTVTDEEREKHVAECIKDHEKEMERSFAIQRSQEKTCGICMDVVWEKAEFGDQRFGILSNCNHVFCLQCIRKWRSAKQFENKIVRACPECRVKSDFVTPSRYWVEDADDKKKLIEEYKQALSKKPCKYFNKGRGECPFNEKCFYLHAFPDGRIASPKPVYRRHRPQATPASHVADAATHMVLYEILEGFSLDHIEDLFFRLNLFELSFHSSSDEDDDDFDDSDASAAL